MTAKTGNVTSFAQNTTANDCTEIQRRKAKTKMTATRMINTELSQS